MFDNVRMSAMIDAPGFVKNRSNEPSVWRGITFCPRYHPNGDIIYYIGEWQNLRLKITKERLIVENSLHKFYYNENFSDFNYNDLAHVVDKICLKFGLTPWDFKMHKFEFGFNLELAHSPETVYESIAGYKSVDLAPMQNGSNVYGVKMKLYDYEIKLYNKTYEHKNHNKKLLSQNYLRVEIEYKNTKKAPVVRLLSDLLKKDILEELFNLYIKDISKIEFRPDVFDLRRLTPGQRSLVFAGSSAEFWKIEKAINSNTAKAKRKRYLNLIKNTEQSSGLVENLTRKFAQLIC